MSEEQFETKPDKKKFGGRQEGSGAKEKFDYDSDAFYEEIFNLAMQGANDGEIAYALRERFSKKLAPCTFSLMKRGRYQHWTEEENARRSERIQTTLARARCRVNQIVRGRYLKAALGGMTLKHKTTVRRKLKIDGRYTEDEEIQTTLVESETAPNPQALAMWLYHHDDEWRRIQKGEETEDENEKAEVGIDISQWIEQETRIHNNE